MNPRPGEIWLADLGWAAKFRPVVIVSRQDPDPPRFLIIYVPYHHSIPTERHEVTLPHLRFLERDSYVNVIPSA
jgi:mRNA interferase MazF